MIHPLALNYTASLIPGRVTRPQEQYHFKNPYNQAFWMDEIRFSVFDVFTGGNPARPQYVWARFRLGADYFVDQFVPLTQLCPRTDMSEDISTLGHNGALIWKLPKPLWVGSREDFSVELFLDNQATVVGVEGPPSGPMGTNTVATVTVTFVGRSTDEPRPLKRFLPFVANWQINPPFVKDTAVGLDPLLSPDTNLYNERPNSVLVTRMFCDMVTDASVTAKVSHSGGNYILKDATPLPTLFAFPARHLDTRCVLKPKEFLTVELNFDAQPNFYNNIHDDQNFYGGIALQGYEEVPLRP